jgi:hypothetical protein
LPALARITLNPSTISPWLLEHELGHALGFGTNWGCFLRNGGDGGAAPNHVDTDPQFVGPQAVAAYRALTGNQNEQTVPVAGTAEETVPGSAGTIRDAHWRQSLFNTDLMVHNIGIKLSLVTIASMADLGYTVNPGAATPGFSLSTLPPTPEQPGAAANNCSQQPKNDDGY